MLRKYVTKIEVAVKIHLQLNDDNVFESNLNDIKEHKTDHLREITIR